MQQVQALFAHGFAPFFGAVFVGGVVAATCGFAHVAGFAAHGEVFGPQGVVVKEFDGPGGDKWAQGFDEVASEGFAAVGEVVVVTDVGIEAGEVDLSHHVVVQQGVAEGEGDVVGVARRVAVAFAEVEAGGQDAGNAIEGRCRRLAFDAAQGGGVGDGAGELVEGALESWAMGWCRRFCAICGCSCCFCRRARLPRIFSLTSSWAKAAQKAGSVL